MQVFYSDQNVLWDWSVPSVFLAGPTPRSEDVPSWRPAALKILADWGFRGQVLVPERRDWQDGFEYESQVAWEWAGLDTCDAIVFWVPADPVCLPALSTRTEFGGYIVSAASRCVYGRPDGSYKTLYLDQWYRRFVQDDPLTTLEDTLALAVAKADLNFQFKDDY